jgi:hypothetical protein
VCEREHMPSPEEAGHRRRFQSSTNSRGQGKGEGEECRGRGEKRTENALWENNKILASKKYQIVYCEVTNHVWSLMGSRRSIKYTKRYRRYKIQLERISPLWMCTVQSRMGEEE